MVQDLSDDAGLGDERDDAHCAAAVFANQRVGGSSWPSVGEGFYAWEASSSLSSGVVAVVQDGMLVGLGNVDEHPGEEFERVEELGFSIFDLG